MIKVVLNQISGERGESPRSNDRMIIDMTILSDQNTWPGGAHTLGTMDWNAYTNAARQKIQLLCDQSNYRKHDASKKVSGQGLSPATAGRLTDIHHRQVAPLNKFPYMSHPNSTQLIAAVHGDHPSQGEKVIHLSVKIRYHWGYPIKVGINFQNNATLYRYLHAATFNVTRVGSTLSVTLAKAIMFTENGFERMNF